MLFKDLPLDHRILKTLEIKGFEEMTDIQKQAIPQGLLGKDLLASSKTGSGKTFAFLIPAIQRVLKTRPLSKKDPRVLVLAPTRELAKQVFMQLKLLTSGLKVSSALILGGENFNDQVKALRRNPQFVVGTAGRVADHVKDRSLFLNGLEMLVLDEADRMLDLGFAEHLKLISMSADHRKRQTMMFSATLDSAELHFITGKLLQSPVRISVGQSNEQHSQITQQFFLSDHVEHKEKLLTKAIETANNEQVIVFTATRDDTDRLSQLLVEQGMQSVALSGNMIQSQRNNIMNAFSRGQQQILVTTDVASRGLDLLKVQLVINFDLPKVSDEYIHRIGRTGRAGNTGHAISFVGPKDWASFCEIRAYLKQDIVFSEFTGLEPTFKGKQDPKRKPTKAKVKKQKVKSTSQPKSTVARVKTRQGVDVGDAPMRRKK